MLDGDERAGGEFDAIDGEKKIVVAIEIVRRIGVDEIEFAIDARSEYVTRDRLHGGVPFAGQTIDLFRLPIDGHRNMGMQATVVVGGSSGGGGGTTTGGSTTTSGGGYGY